MNYTKWLNWGIITGLFLALFIPFVVSSGGVIPSMFFPYITGKNFAFRIIVEIVFGLYVLLAIRDAKYRPQASWILYAVGAFVLWMGLATLTSVDPIKSFWGNFERMDGYINTLHLFLYFITAGAVLSANKLWDKFFQVSVAASLLQGLLAVSQVFHWFGLSPSSQSGVRADGTFGNATYLAVYMLFNFFITLFLISGILKDKKGIKNSWVLLSFYGVALVLQFLAVFFTETRGAILGLIGGLIVGALYIAIFGRGRGLKVLRRASWGILALIVVLVGAFFALKDTSIVRNQGALSRLASISLEDKTTASRFIIWNMALQGAAEKPVLGWGQENFNFVFNKYYDPAMYSQEQWFDRAHNEFLDWLIAGGAPAFALYLSFFLLAAWAIFRSKDLSVPEQAALLGILAAYGFNNLFVFDNLLSLVYFYTILALTHSFSKQALPKWMLLSRPGNDQMVAIAAPIVLVLMVGGGWVLNGPALTRAQTLIDALQSQNQKTGATYTVEDHLSTFEKALSQGELGKQETIEQLFQFTSNSVAPSTSVSPDTKQKAYTLTENAGVALLKQRPNDARLELFMGVFYTQFGQTQKALAEFTRAIEHSPNKQQILFQTGVTYLSSGDVENTLALFKKAYDLAPAYPDARVLYATGLYYAHKNTEADALLTEGFGSVLYDDTRLLQTYMSLKMYDRVVAIWNKKLEAAPKDTNVLLGLASAYFQMGNTAQTIATIQKVIEIDPTSKTQMEAIIKQIQDGTLKPQ
ncbi:MAG: O-antigen ligase family protein [Patescibacteria group bacterium]